MIGTLFLVFLKIGAVSFGGGYGMIALIRESVLANGWLTEEELLNFIAVAESTPGPIAVNMATFVGASQAGIAGALAATLGVVLPAFLILLLLSAFLGNLLQRKAVRAALDGVRPVIVGLILATAASMFLSVVLGVAAVSDLPSPDGRAALIFAVLLAVSLAVSAVGKRRRAAGKRARHVSPILLILLSGLLGMALYAA